MSQIRTQYWTLYHTGESLERDGPFESEGGLPMIFRHFLAPKTGCASYLFG